MKQEDGLDKAEKKIQEFFRRLSIGKKALVVCMGYLPFILFVALNKTVGFKARLAVGPIAIIFFGIAIFLSGAAINPQKWGRDSRMSSRKKLWEGLGYLFMVGGGLLLSFNMIRLMN